MAVIFPQHVDQGRQEKIVSLLTGFRNYLHYHLKATKTYMHMRMRKRVAGLLQGESRYIYIYIYIRGPVNADITGFLCSRYNNAFYFMEIPSFLAPSCHWQLR